MNRFFRNKSINVKVVRDESANGSSSETPEDPFVGVEVAAAYAEVAKDFITHAALTIGGAFCICKIVERICK